MQLVKTRQGRSHHVVEIYLSPGETVEVKTYQQGQASTVVKSNVRSVASIVETIMAYVNAHPGDGYYDHAEVVIRPAIFAALFPDVDLGSIREYLLTDADGRFTSRRTLGQLRTRVLVFRLDAQRW